MVILRELHDDPGRPLTPPLLNSDLMRQIRSHYTRVDGSLNEQGFYIELFGVPVNPSDFESRDESDNDSSTDNDCFIIPRSSFTGKELVRFDPMVLDDLSGGMETSSRFTSAENTVLRILNIAPSQLHPNSWAFVKAFQIVYMRYFLSYETWSSTPNHLFPFYWTSDPREIKGVNEAHLTTFERETVTFLDSICRLDTKDLLQRETNVDSIVEYLKRMRTVSEDDWLSYLAKSTQKKLEPEALISPEVQLVVGEKDGAKGAK
ncbi:hypothetical protein A2U01_0002726, partial [Trifolium medium]|nr:hypothetical protein [Trifolium medium]